MKRNSEDIQRSRNDVKWKQSENKVEKQLET